MQVKPNKNNAKVFSQIQSLQSCYERAISDGLDTIGENLIRTNKIDFRARKTGRHHEDLPNRSSARGEPPAYQSGVLEHSLFTRSTGNTMFYGATAPYAKALETTMDRPFLSKSITDNNGNNVSILFELLGSYLS